MICDIATVEIVTSGKMGRVARQRASNIGQKRPSFDEDEASILFEGSASMPIAWGHVGAALYGPLGLFAVKGRLQKPFNCQRPDLVTSCPFWGIFTSLESQVLHQEACDREILLITWIQVKKGSICSDGCEVVWLRPEVTKRTA